ncbi:hypothetical protein [Cryobacterium sp. GrIS_2_6]|uniref:hypothetical protein n=1 Tax=Cryobacterium sp. GrIS_2_6 TaxID=3162785 RepID=UPI002DF9FEA2|nr:hypothetical protein [Cryobacterium psychrotolerans]MEC5149227.1 hypothetical protein [Cryobacterium psychrotolerans]MEC5149307.1 hypothetical protein [Cryobacterium psychrotolerans]
MGRARATSTRHGRTGKKVRKRRPVRRSTRVIRVKRGQKARHTGKKATTGRLRLGHTARVSTALKARAAKRHK